MPEGGSESPRLYAGVLVAEAEAEADVEVERWWSNE